MLLLNYDANIEGMSLRAAVQHGSVIIVKSLLVRGADPNWMDIGVGSMSLGNVKWEYDQRSVLTCVVAWFDLTRSGERITVPTEILTALLDAGADINAKDSMGRTALMWAVFTENEKAVSLLLKRGADVTVTAKNNDTALSVARQLGNINITRLLQQTGAEQQSSSL